MPRTFRPESPRPITTKGSARRWKTSLAFFGARCLSPRSLLLKIIDDAKSFEQLDEHIRAEHEAKRGAVFDEAVRFFAESDPSGLNVTVQERLAQALSRMVESEEALRLAAVLEV